MKYVLLKKRIYIFVSIFSDTLKTRRVLVTEQDQEFSEQVQTKEI